MRWSGRIIGLVVVAATANGCSAYEDVRRTDFAKQGAAEIIGAAEKATGDLDRVRMTGAVRDDSTQYFVDLRLSRKGDCAGSLRVEGRNVDIRRVGDRAWFKGDSGFFRLVAGGRVVREDALAKLTTKWVVIPDAPFEEFCDLDALLDDFWAPDGLASEKKKRNDAAAEVDPNDVEVGEETTLDGVTAVRLGARPGGTHDEHVWVSSEAPHHILRLESESTEDGGSITFSEHDAEFEVVAPNAEDVYRE